MSEVVFVGDLYRDGMGVCAGISSALGNFANRSIFMVVGWWNYLHHWWNFICIEINEEDISKQKAAQLKRYKKYKVKPD